MVSRKRLIMRRNHPNDQQRITHVAFLLALVVACIGKKSTQRKRFMEHHDMVLMDGGRERTVLCFLTFKLSTVPSTGINSEPQGHL
jgi:hypothetical protein